MSCLLGKPSNCTTCIDELPLLFKGTCIDHCPDKYEENNQVPNQCVLVGLICPEGFHVNAQGEGCVPNEFECKEGYEINERNTACIPVPGTPIPFPFLFMAFCMSLVVAYSKFKEGSQTKVCTSLIFLFGLMELPIYFLMTLLAYRLEKYQTTLLSGISLLMLLFSNILFLVLYATFTLDDKVFSEWLRVHSKVKTWMPWCILTNFKSVRFLLSGFFGMENCQAPFHNANKNIHRYLKVVTYF